MPTQMLRYLSYMAVWPLATALSYHLLGGTNLFVYTAVLSSLPAVIVAFRLADRDDLDGILWLVVGYSGTVASVIIATWPRFVVPFTLPESLVKSFLWFGLVVIGLHILDRLLGGWQFIKGYIALYLE